MMSLGQRIGARAKELGLSQAALARRSGVPQSTVNTLINSDARWSPHTLKLARVLQTTPDYLVGETDNPDEGAPPLSDIDHETQELIDNIERLAPADRRALLQIARSMSASRSASDTVHTQRPEIRGAEVADD
jgi:transcriptional regulator with XRE-family HTH domain